MTQDNNQKEDIDWENFFTIGQVREVFLNTCGNAVYERATEGLNQIVREVIEKYGRKVLLDETYWSFTSDAHFKRKATMEAILINIRKIDE